MSKLTDTKQAYDKIADLLDQEIRKRSGNISDLKRFREALDVAFYLLGWAQFEYLVRKQAEEVIKQEAQAKTIHGIAWEYILENTKAVPLRKRLGMIFHGNTKLRESLNNDYDLRNEAAHNYKLLPREARDISPWLEELEELIDKF